MYILGISGLYHDSAAALIRDGHVLSAVQEERFSRIKNDRLFPRKAIDYCLRANQIESDDLDAVVFYDDPLATLDRFLHNCAYAYPDVEDILGNQYEKLFRERLWVHRAVKEACGSFGKNQKLLICDHHISHAASAFYVSGFDESAILVLDAVGEWATTTLGIGRGTSIQILKQINYPHSLGFLYSAFTYFCGFKVNSGEYKLMGLSSYGKPVYSELIKSELIDIHEDGSFFLNMDYFEFQYGRAITGKRFEDLFGSSRREPDGPFSLIYLDLAASIQEVTEEIIIKMARHLKSITGMENLCMAGGVALNCMSNEKLSRQGLFRNIFIQPAAGDAGGAVGAALYAYHNYYGQERLRQARRFNPFLGPSFTDEQIAACLDRCGAVYHVETDREILLEKTASLIAKGNVAGFFQGAMEFGPRALGHRSILADPTDPNMQVRMNKKIKFRESFRPFAPSVTEEQSREYFDLGSSSPYMLLTAPVKQHLRMKADTEETDIYKKAAEIRSVLPAVTHVDYSARVQTVSREDDALYYDLLKKFEEIKGYPVLVNTSFNVRGEPIVCSPFDAYACFMRTDMDVLVMGNIILYKSEQREDKERWDRKFEED